MAWARELWAKCRALSPSGMYVNFAGFGEEGDELVRAAYGSNYARLAQIKAKYDPANLFRVNQNIKPA